MSRTVAMRLPRGPHPHPHAPPRPGRRVLGAALMASLGLGLSATLAPAADAATGDDAARTQLGAGVWANYRYVVDDPRDKESLGDFADEAFILYADGQAGGEGRWAYSAELRIGPGSFTDPQNNPSGNNFALHKAWIGWQLAPQRWLRFGKSQVPFAWKTVNFWPGDVLLAGYGDQMDVGLKYSQDAARWRLDLAYYHADDWGETSTDTVDDNGHWGSSDSYRKVQTVVANVEYQLWPGQRLALSAQAGGLQDLSSVNGSDNPISGEHEALALWWHGEWAAFYAKAAYILQQRELPESLRAAANLPPQVENSRMAVELGYRRGDWFFYLDSSAARADTPGGLGETVYAHAPGLSYDYGPGWIYLELLSQDGFVDRQGQVQAGDFDALYLSADFYL